MQERMTADFWERCTWNQGNFPLPVWATQQVLPLTLFAPNLITPLWNQSIQHWPSRCWDTMMRNEQWWGSYCPWCTWGEVYVLPVLLQSPDLLQQLGLHGIEQQRLLTLHEHVWSTTLAHSIIQGSLCFVCVCVTSRCCRAPCSSHSCLCLMTWRHSSLYTPEGGGERTGW